MRLWATPRLFGPSVRAAAFLAGAVLVAGPRGAAAELRWTELTAKAGGAKGLVQLASGELLATRTRHKDNDTRVVCFQSKDGGRVWRELSVITQAPGDWDMGDGHLVQLQSGEVLYAGRHNQVRERASEPETYSIRVAASQDAGKTWRPHSVVAASVAEPGAPPNHRRGLWSSFLLPKRDGTLLCFFDDEDTPCRAGFPGHQWLTQKTWDPSRQSWDQPVTVSRTEQRDTLARDGMASAVELDSGRLLAAFESVQTQKPHANLVRFVTSDDGGKSWNWRDAGRPVLFQPADHRHLAVSPWLTRLAEGTLVCVFATDEDRAEADRPGAPPPEFHMDIKYVVSRDAGKTWSRRSEVVFNTTHRCYAPGIATLQNGTVLVMFTDFSLNGARAWRGDLVRP